MMRRTWEDMEVEGSWKEASGHRKDLLGVGPAEAAPHSGIHIQCPGHKVLRKSHGQKHRLRKVSFQQTKLGRCL